MLKSALAYASRFKWYIFPLEPKSKSPLVKDWPNRASNNPMQIRKWWSRWPDANIGLATGKSDLLVIDIDEKKGVSGMESWRDILMEHDIDTDTITQLTPSGGEHIFYLCSDKRLRNTANGLGEGIDTRGDGGYVVVAPSVNGQGGVWEWDKELHPADKPIAPLPDTLKRLLLDYDRTAGPAPPVEGNIIAGSRNETLASLAGTMRRRNMPEEAILLALLTTNQTMCQPPLPEAEVRRIAKSISRYPAGTPEMEQVYALTDLGNSERLVSIHGTNIRYCHGAKTWLAWDGRRWNLDRTKTMLALAAEVSRLIAQEQQLVEDKAKRKAIHKHALATESRHRLTSMLELATSNPAITVVPEDLDSHAWLLNTENCIIDLQTGQALEHDPTYLMTKMVEANYDPDAECPLWRKFLDEVFAGNQDLIRFVQKAMGYSLTGSTREQCMFILYGTGANGKSTLLEVIAAIVQEYMNRTPTETLLVRKTGSIPNDIARLAGARMVAATETEDGSRLAESLVKQMTGGEKLTARFLHAEWFEFQPQFKVWLATNHKPQIRGTDHAVWRRMRLLPFTVTIPAAKQDKDLPQKLLEERDGIFRWIVDGCLTWQEEGLEPPKVVTEATAQYKSEMDVLAAFIRDCCNEGPNMTSTVKELYDSYSTWTGQSGEKTMPKRTFGMKVRDRGFTVVRGTGGVRSWHGIALNTKPVQHGLNGIE